MERSENIEELGKALALAQRRFGSAKKTSANPHFKSRYADLSEVWEACHAALNDNGIAILQTPFPGLGEGEIGIRTMLLHTTGQWVACSVVIPLAKNDAQGIGSAITYARRYGLMALVGVCPEDDDGNAAAQPMVDLRKETLPGLREAALSGMAALSTAWARLSREQQSACKADKEALKQAAASSDAAAAEHDAHDAAVGAAGHAEVDALLGRG